MMIVTDGGGCDDDVVYVMWLTDQTGVIKNFPVLQEIGSSRLSRTPSRSSSSAF